MRSTRKKEMARAGRADVNACHHVTTPRVWWLPKTDSRIGAVFYSGAGSIVTWLVLELPQHIVITWR